MFPHKADALRTARKRRECYGKWTAAANGELVWVAQPGILKRSTTQLNTEVKNFSKAIGKFVKSNSQHLTSERRLKTYGRAIGFVTKPRPFRNPPHLPTSPKVVPQSFLAELEQYTEKIKVIVRGKRIEDQIEEQINDISFSHSFVRRSSSTFYISRHETCAALLNKVSCLVGCSLEDLKVVPKGWKRACSLNDVPLTCIADLIGASAPSLELFIIDKHKKNLRRRWEVFKASHLHSTLPPLIQSCVYAFLDLGTCSKLKVPLNFVANCGHRSSFWYPGSAKVSCVHPAKSQRRFLESRRLKPERSQSRNGETTMETCMGSHEDSRIAV